MDEWNKGTRGEWEEEGKKKRGNADHPDNPVTPSRNRLLYPISYSCYIDHQCTTIKACTIGAPMFIGRNGIPLDANHTGRY